MIVPDNIQKCKHNVESVKHIESNKKIVETNLLLKMSSFNILLYALNCWNLLQKHKDGKGVSDHSETSE